jgi:predicted dehydrogenase
MGTYLPDWHAYEGIEDFYASDIQLGGGNIDVIAQELIWLLWITGGTPQSVTAREGTAGSLPLAPGTPDFIEMILELDEVTMNLHFDINDRTHETYLRMSGEDQTAVWSKVAFGALRLFTTSDGSWRSAEPYAPENPEAHYVDEIGAWIACLQNREEWPVSLEMAGAVVRVLEGMRLSSHEGSCVRIAGH